MIRNSCLKRISTRVRRKSHRLLSLSSVLLRETSSSSESSLIPSAASEKRMAASSMMVAASSLLLAATTSVVLQEEHDNETLSSHKILCSTTSKASFHQLGWSSATEPGTVEHMEDMLKRIKLISDDEYSGYDTSPNHNDHDRSLVSSLEQEKEKNQAHFPTLKASLIVDDATQERQPFVINSTNPMPIETDLFVGTMQLVLKPLQASHDINFDENRQPPFSIELQGHVKKDLPRLQLYMGAQILEPMDFGSLGSIGKRVCGILLHLLGRNIDGDMHYSFGTKDEHPYIAFPLVMAMRHSVVDPSVDSSSPIEQEEQDDHWKTSYRYNMKYTADSIDLASWKVRRPFEFPLQSIWGKGTPLQLIIYHQETPTSPRSYLLRLQLDPIPQADDQSAELPIPLSGSVLATSNK